MQSRDYVSVYQVPNASGTSASGTIISGELVQSAFGIVTFSVW